MRVYRLRLFGFEVATYEVDGEPVDMAAAMREAIEQLADDGNTEDSSDTGSEIGSEIGSVGGAAQHDFERDLNPRYPEAEKDYDSWMPRPFGFHRGPS